MYFTSQDQRYAQAWQLGLQLTTDLRSVIKWNSKIFDLRAFPYFSGLSEPVPLYLDGFLSFKGSVQQKLR
jgi:hypothetical protein